MININEVIETNKMIDKENLDVRTITLGISLLDCVDSDLDELNRKIYEKITTVAKDLVSTGKDIEKEFGIPIVNKRISITPVSLVGAAACKTPEDYVTIARTLDRAAEKVGVNFIGGYSALVSKGMTPSEENLIRSIPQALAETERICSSVNVGSTKTGINMDAVRLCGQIVKEAAEATKDRDSLGCAKLVILCNAPDDNPFMAGAFLGVTEADTIINVGVSGPGVVKKAIEKVEKETAKQRRKVVIKVRFKMQNRKNLRCRLDRATLHYLTDKKIRELQWDNGNMRLTLDLKALRTIRKQTAKEVSLTLKKIGSKKILSKIKKTNRKRFAYEFSIIDAKKKKISSIKKGKITIELGYQRSHTDKKSKMYVYQMNKNGSAVNILKSHNDVKRKKIRFWVNHPCRVVIGRKI